MLRVLKKGAGLEYRPRSVLQLSGVALLSVGGFAGLRFARSWPSVRGRRLL